MGRPGPALRPAAAWQMEASGCLGCLAWPVSSKSPWAKHRSAAASCSLEKPVSVWKQPHAPPGPARSRVLARGRARGGPPDQIGRATVDRLKRKAFLTGVRHSETSAATHSNARTEDGISQLFSLFCLRVSPGGGGFAVESKRLLRLPALLLIFPLHRISLCQRHSSIP